MIDIKSFRAAKNLRQYELADMLGFDRGYLSHVETGKREMPKELFTKFIDYFGEGELSPFLIEDLQNKTIPFFDKEYIIGPQQKLNFSNLQSSLRLTLRF